MIKRVRRTVEVALPKEEVGLSFAHPFHILAPQTILLSVIGARASRHAAWHAANIQIAGGADLTASMKGDRA